jgi:hypothetical protein
MNRSRSQAMAIFLPGAVFRHEMRLRGRVQAVDGELVKKLNEDVIYDEIARYLARWSEEARIGLPLPHGRPRQNYVLISPDLVRFEVFPLVLECTRRTCRRVRTYFKPQQLTAEPRCRACRGRLRQLPYYDAHNCGAARSMYVPKCRDHGWDHIVFENTGSFITAVWRCVGAGCGGVKLQGTAQRPCGCEWKDASGRAMMRARTLNDTRAYQVHSLQLVNIDNTEFRQYQRHPQRGRIAAAHYLNHIDRLSEGIAEASQSITTTRMSPQEWQQKEQQLRAMMNEEAFEQLRKLMAPQESGLAALPATDADNARWEILGADRPFLERAAVYDRSQISRITLDDQRERFTELQDQLALQITDRARDRARTLGIEEIAVTWEFPVARIAFGYTREGHEPDEGYLTGFHHRNHHDNKYPVYVAAANTEALLVTFSARQVLTFMQAKGFAIPSAGDDSTARRCLLELFTAQDDDPDAALAARTVYTVIHTLSHLLLRALDDGQVGLAENSLAEWIVPNALTIAIYADNVREFTLGSLWTLLSNRVLSWLENTADSVLSCENDPLCHQSSPRCCERCVYLTFGCPLFNDDLDRALAADFIRHTCATERG